MKTKLSLITALLLTLVTFAQDLSFTFQNARNTNDGTDDFYEADIFVASSVDIKVGSGILFFNYNTLAFGEAVDNRNEGEFPGSFEYLQPEGSMLGQFAPGPFGNFNFYRDFVVNDNTPSRVAVSFQPNASRGVLTEVTATPRFMCGIKFKYIDINEDPGVEFANDDNPLFEDGFFDACGPDAPGQADCINEPGTQIVGDENFDSSEAVLSIADIIAENPDALKIYSISSTDLVIEGLDGDSYDVSVYNMLGMVVSRTTIESTGYDVINQAYTAPGILFVNIADQTGSITKKIAVSN